MTTDADLVAGVRAGDASAAGALYVRYHGRACAVARSVERDPDAADDLVAEAFTRVLEALHGGGGPVVAFWPYLATVIRHLSTDRFRVERRLVHIGDADQLDSMVTPVELDGDGMLVDGATGAASPVGAVLAAFERDAVRAALARLEPSSRTVVEEVVVDGRTPGEAAARRGVSVQAMWARAYRSRERLRQAYLSVHVASSVGGDCGVCAAYLGAFVRDALRPRRRRWMEQHLDGCAGCRHREEEVRSLNRSMPGTVGGG